MNLNANKFALAAALAAGIAWVVCGIIVFLAPAFMTDMTGHMIHMDISDLGLMMSMQGMLLGFVGWVVLAGLFAWLLGTLYNLINARSSG